MYVCGKAAYGWATAPGGGKRTIRRGEKYDGKTGIVKGRLCKKRCARDTPASEEGSDTWTLGTPGVTSCSSHHSFIGILWNEGVVR